MLTDIIVATDGRYGFSAEQIPKTGEKVDSISKRSDGGFSVFRLYITLFMKSAEKCLGKYSGEYTKNIENG